MLNAEQKGALIELLEFCMVTAKFGAEPILEELDISDQAFEEDIQVLEELV